MVWFDFLERRQVGMVFTLERCKDGMVQHLERCMLRWYGFATSRDDGMIWPPRETSCLAASLERRKKNMTWLSKRSMITMITTITMITAITKITMI